MAYLAKKIAKLCKKKIYFQYSDKGIQPMIKKVLLILCCPELFSEHKLKNSINDL